MDYAGPLEHRPLHIMFQSFQSLGPRQFGQNPHADLTRGISCRTKAFVYPFLPHSFLILATMASSRRVQFNGDDVAYIRFLEDRVLELEGILQSPSHQRGHARNSQSITNRANSRDTAGPSSNEVGDRSTKLQFIEFVPPRERASKAPNDTQKRRQSGLDILLEKVPSLSKWTSNKYNLSHRNLNVLKGLVANEKPPNDSKNPSQPIDIIPILLRFSNLTLNVGPEKGFLAKLARFREFIFMSLCAVALKLELVDDAASVYGVMQSFIGFDAREKHLLKLIRGVTWANQLISELSTTAWAPGCSYVLFSGW